METNPTRLGDAVAYVAHRIGRHPDVDDLAGALAAAIEVTRLDRTAVGSDGSRLPELATALCALLEIQVGIGDHTSALSTLGECRQLVRSHSGEAPENLLVYLADRHVDFARWLAAEEDEAAADTFADAVELWRRLAALDRESYGPRLAGMLHQMSLVYEADGQPHPATAAALEAVELSRQLIPTEPAGFLAVHAERLSQLFDVSNEVGDRDIARPALAELADVYRWLVASGERDHLPALAHALAGLAWEQEHTGDRSGAARTAGEAIEIQTPLAAKHPDEHRQSLARLLLGLSLYQYEENDHGAALETSAQALRHWTALLATQPIEALEYLLETIELWFRLRPSGVSDADARRVWDDAVEGASHHAVRAEIRAACAAWRARCGDTADAEVELRRAASDVDSLVGRLDQESYWARRNARQRIRLLVQSPDAGFGAIDLPRWATILTEHTVEVVDSFAHLAAAGDPGTAAPWIEANLDVVFRSVFVAQLDEFEASEPELSNSLIGLRRLATEVISRDVPRDRLAGVLREWIQGAPTWEEGFGFLDAVDVMRNALVTAGRPVELVGVVVPPDR
ncbi:MAG: hypothetical protein ACRCYQ_05395 [Nocardioides sp.]